MNNKNKRTSQKGFTLIELMIVVAVIGVLSAIAVPQYQNYVKKSALGTALASVTAYKTIIEDNIAFENQFPTISAAFGIGTISATSGAVNTTQTVVAEIKEGSGTGTKVQLSRDSDGLWTCGHSQSDIKLTGCEYDSNI
ncbi:prepilin-type N-terminal cleavage/methylation domain-containing protein [Vibrio sp. 10N.261.51.A3]|uniref:pilin n=1 Tax=Vibrio sp. 10N.261.51.A3 TaxID=3229673 RepID=UPI00354D3455